MTPENFIYWLQGKLEIGDTKSLNEQEVQIIKDHIALVLKKETPKRHELKITADPKQNPDTITIQPMILTQPALGPYLPTCRGLGGLPCGRLGCPSCNPVAVTC